jgi:hypothetical protein
VKRYHLYSLETGLFNGRSFAGPESEEFVRLNTPDGYGAMEGVADDLSQRVDLGTGMLVEYIPPSPEPTVDYEWSAENKRWLKTADATMRDARRTAALKRIAELELQKLRPLGELQLAQARAEAPNPETVERLDRIEQQIAALREDLK